MLNTSVLKLKTRYMPDSLEVKTNTPTTAYVAILAHYPNPLPSDYENTGLSMSLLQVIDRTSTGKGAKKFVAKKSAKLVIYQKKFTKGLIQIKFAKAGLNSKGIPLVVFFGFDSTLKNPSICTGKEILISLSTDKYFKKCLASSEKPGYKCEDGFSHKMRDEAGGMWASKFRWSWCLDPNFF